jgi:squalene-hopene/tetraprenyl-beta-curcumene cyclase
MFSMERDEKSLGLAGDNKPVQAEHYSPNEHDAIWSSVRQAWRLTRDHLRREQTAAGHWVGQLSTSALSTATAISAMVQVLRSGGAADTQVATINTAIEQGLDWLLQHQNQDGGWGDTDRSYSNIATSFLVIAAMRLVRGPQANSLPTMLRAWEYVHSQGAWDGLRRRYGKDKTFVVPILSNCALAGLVPWSQVAALPFEAAWLPQKWYRLARMPVVSYAIPALVAIGQARFHFAPPKFAPHRWLRRAAIAPTLAVLERMQPASGGYLEATPLTSFVLMNLAATGQQHSMVAQNCLRFILDSRLADGSWPIDTNLATWGTSLAWHALSRRSSLVIVRDDTHCSKFGGQSTPQNDKPDQEDELEAHNSARETISESGLLWLLSCQHRAQHPFTGATPGGWGWTDLSGAVPDADDTPAALLALSRIDWNASAGREHTAAVYQSIGLGLRWLMELQNRDGGWPTFCKGWGKLPFDRSGTDLTAHALRAINVWQDRLPQIARSCSTCPSPEKLQRSTQRGLKFIFDQQQSNGSWLPLWFGNQDRREEDNPFYGTGKVLLALGQLGLFASAPVRRAQAFLRAAQNPDGGWGGDWLERNCENQNNGGHHSTIEESAAVLEGLIACSSQSTLDSTIMTGLGWLADSILNGGLEFAKPIGFYFAKLWYYEKLYPALFGLSALGTALGHHQKSTHRA